MLGLNKKRISHRKSIGEVALQGIQLQLPKLMQPRHDLFVRISTGEDILPLQLNVVEEVSRVME